ncbi:tellurite resistance TerB C-terminal domain-containing protein [Caproiciproducens galactitolivorans]|uniref:TerB-C domain-containing protein n=1 Tax=Caproiciproducens galactitolivorans TaxID=642589 RepID=A0ABT4BWU9_9FIRM|nr:tellurite resistance TerB C-terminal domain-containing protein [Caproiciproducens galactitolivorans]MCY1714533.1 hypothetical protein [Caproiciproducens galactitolivorans]
MSHTTSTHLDKEFKAKVTQSRIDYFSSKGQEAVTKDDLIKAINEGIGKLKLNTLLIIVIIFLTIFANPAFFWLFLLCIPVSTWDKRMKTTVLNYEIDAEMQRHYQLFLQSFLQINNTQKMWNITQLQKLNSIYDQKKNAGAGSLIGKTSVAPPQIVQADCLVKPFYIKTNIDVLLFDIHSIQILFLPEIVLIKKGNLVTFANYSAVLMHTSATRFIENGSVPKDGRVIDYTWRYVNQNGTPDKRYKNNRKIPVVSYGLLSMDAANFTVELMTSNDQTPVAAGKAVSSYQAYLKSCSQASTQHAEPNPVQNQNNTMNDNSNSFENVPVGMHLSEYKKAKEQSASQPVDAIINDSSNTPLPILATPDITGSSATPNPIKINSGHFEDTPLMVRPDEYKKAKENFVPQSGDAVIDISNIIPSPITAASVTPSLSVPTNDYWIQQLEIPYERSIMQNPQIKSETLRMYSALCSYADNLLKSQGKSLEQEVQRLQKRAGYYDNILYTFYCIAEGHVTKGYSGRDYYNYDYSYQILQSHIGEQLKQQIYKKAVALEQNLPAPSEETCRDFSLTPNGLPIVWWDWDGSLRAQIAMTPQEISILKCTPSRNTKLWDLPAVKQEIVSLYLNLWGIIQRNFSKDIKWKKYVRENLQAIANGTYNYNQYYEKICDLLSALLKMSESTVRSLLPKSSYTQSLKTDQEQHVISLFLPKQCVAELDAYLAGYPQAIPPAKVKAMLSALSNSEAGNWRTAAELLLQSPSEDWVTILLQNQKTTDYEKLLHEIVKTSENKDLVLLVIFELNRFSKLTPALKKKVEHLLYENNLPYFEKLASSTTALTEEVFHNLLKLKEPVRKTIQLNSTEIEKSKQELNETVSILTDFADESTDTTDSSSADTEIPEETGQNPNAIGGFSTEAVHLVQKILEQGQIPAQELEEYALSQGKLLNSYISGINQEFFDYIGDQLLLIDNDQIIVDEFYIDLAKELLTHEA